VSLEARGDAALRIAPAQDRSIDEDAIDHYEAEAARWAMAGRPDHAAHFYAATLDHRPGDTRVRMMLAGCLARCNQVAAAAGQYLRVALEYAAQRRDREAMALAYQVLHLDASQFVYVAVAETLRGIGRPARELCARAAEAHLQAGRLVDGLHMLQLGAEIDAKNPDVRRRLAQLYLSQHMTGPAVVNLVEAGRLLLAAGNNAEYVDVAEQILRVDARHLETLRELPRVLLRVGEPQRAVVKLADLMRVSPGDTVGYETLAHAFVAIDRVPTALSVLERLVGELLATGRALQAEAILERARHWRHDDPKFARAVLALREPKPATAPPRLERAPARTTGEGGEGTVVLDITDLLVSGDIAVAVAAHDRASSPRASSRAPAPPSARPSRAHDPVVDLSDDVIELEEVEGTLVLRLQDLSHVGRVPRRPSGPPPAPGRVPPPTSRRVPPPAARRVPPPAPRRALPPPRPAAELEATELVGLDDELDDITLVRPLAALGDVAALVLDEDSSELRQDPRSPAARAAMVRRARALAGRAYA
jgi:tetratricopeptide (TPR) repeat protein